MAKTALAWLLIYVGGLLMAFIKGPIFGLLTYVFAYYTQYSWARSLPSMRWSFYAGLVLLASYLLKKNTLPKLSFQRTPQMVWLLLFLLNMILHQPFAVRPDRNLELTMDFANIVIIYYLTINILSSKLFYRIFIWFHIWGNYLWGWQGTFAGKIRHGRLENLGGPGTRESNQLAGQLLLILPFLANRVAFGKNRIEQILVIWASAFIVNILVLCRSRGALLGLAVMTLLWIIFSKGHRVKAIIFATIGVFAFLQLTDPGFWSRMTTIQEYQSDDSATSRLASWAGAIEMVKDYPLGAGGGGWKYFSPVYIPEIVASHGGAGRAVHNTFLQAATDWGVQGVGLFIIFLATSIFELHKIRRRRGLKDDDFFIIESKAVEIGVFGMLVASIFINRMYTELLYLFCGLGTVLANIQQSALLDEERKHIPQQ